ncbi:hypothetical protein HELRODRAFT_168860 [Helobdella robusta]|uniref:Uncharacterized protein n=1 Tax=Helobdella robusta TaxID=6412 RepID=T1F121_HELRO|nr:hypothetical protein HELRODRAFT_168860 [Helobdella robusta]ESO08939.1 hypothetical protein HELRODRAFT_168860 [Helobdella robusta]
MVRQRLKNIIPTATECGYEAFECLVERANEWLKNQVNIQVINIQSVIGKKDNESETGSNCFYTMPGLNATEPVDFFRILRIAYVTSPPTATDSNTEQALQQQQHPAIYPFNYETFTPEIIREKDSEEDRLETMAETFSKVIAFLRNTGG